MSEIKPIETRYNGCKFRSRLEARWGVFFDALGIPWEYEPEGFDLGDGLLYLPDFWLPEHRIYVEIKPASFNGPSCPEFCKYQVIFRRFRDTVGPIALFTGQPCIWSGGDLGATWMGKLWCHDMSDSSGGTSEFGFVLTPGTEGWQLLIKDDGNSQREYCDKDWNILPACQCSHKDDWSGWNPPVGRELKAAFKAARSARFEHGECG